MWPLGKGIPKAPVKLSLKAAVFTARDQTADANSIQTILRSRTKIKGN